MKRLGYHVTHRGFILGTNGDLGKGNGDLVRPLPLGTPDYCPRFREKTNCRPF